MFPGPSVSIPRLLRISLPAPSARHHPLGPHGLPVTQYQPHAVFPGLNGSDFGIEPDRRHWLLLQSLQQDLLGPGLRTVNRLARSEFAVMSCDRDPSKFLAYKRSCPYSEPSSAPLKASRRRCVPASHSGARFQPYDARGPSPWDAPRCPASFQKPRTARPRVQAKGPSSSRTVHRQQWQPEDQCSWLECDTAKGGNLNSRFA